MICLFWNIGRFERLAIVADICVEQGVDLLILAECAVSPMGVLTALANAGLTGFGYAGGPARRDGERPRVFFRHQTAALVHVRDDPLSHVTVRRLTGVHEEVLFVIAHLPSKLHVADPDSRTQLAVRLGTLIRDEEAAAGHTRTVLIGDLNMNPFEAGVVGSEGLHGVMTRTIARSGGRRVAGQDRAYFYNPMWRFFGERADGPPGTYHSRAGGSTTYFWHMLDQVMVRPTLVDRLTRVRILDRVGSRSLLRGSGVPDRAVGSDHLPLLVELAL